MAKSLGAREHRVVTLDLTLFGGSALTDGNIPVPVEGIKNGIPVTYVPARNTIMLSLALAWAETLGARDVFVGVNALRHGRYRWRDVVFVSCPFLVYLWLLALAILLGPAEYGGRGAYGPAPLFGLIALFPVVAFLLFTSKSFVLRCQAMRAADEVPE